MKAAKASYKEALRQRMINERAEKKRLAACPSCAARQRPSL